MSEYLILDGITSKTNYSEWQKETEECVNRYPFIETWVFGDEKTDYDEIIEYLNRQAGLIKKLETVLCVSHLYARKPTAEPMDAKKIITKVK